MRRDAIASRGCVALTAITLLAILGWLSETLLLTTWISGLPSMKLLTALCLLACAGAMATLHRVPSHATAALGGAVAAIGMVVLWQYATGIEIDSLDRLAPAWAATDLGSMHFRIAPSTALCLLLAGIGIVGLAYRAPSELVAACALLLAAVDVLGILGLDANVNGIGLPAHSLPSAAAFLCLSICLLAASGFEWPKLSLRLALSGLVLGALIPAALLITAQTRRVTAQRLAEIDARAQEISDQARRIVDRVITERGVLLRTLAASPALKAGDLAAFHAHASQVAKFPDSVIVVADTGMRMLISTAVPYGAPLPEVADPVTSRRAYDTGQVEVSDVYLSPFRQEPIFGIALAVPGTGYHMRVTMSGYALSEMLAAAVPAGWVMTVLDRKRVIAGRSADMQRWVGQKIPERLRIAAEPVAERGRGVLQTESVDGRASHMSFSRLPMGWSAVALASDATVDDIVKSGSRIALSGWPIAAAVGIGLAALAAFVIGRALARLSIAAESIGTGGVPLPIHSGIVEIDRVASALTNSGTVRARSESEARRQELLFRTVFDSNPDAMMLADVDRKIIRVNPAATRIFGFDAAEAISTPTKSIYAAADDWSAVGRAFDLSPNGEMSGRYTFRRKCGETFPGFLTGVRLVDSSGQFIAYLSIIRDLTVELQREQALLEKRNLEALGRLSSGIAHDFNNILTIVSANLQLIEARVDDPKCLEWAQDADQATRMGARLNQRLMTFARQRRLEPTVVDLNVLVRAALDLVRRATGEHIVVKDALLAQPALVRVDESEMENALVNLALNARDAMRDGGTISVETGNTTVEAGDALVSAGLSPGRYARLSVVDTGTGMTEEVRSRAFEPFFTTKEPGKGTGLGLTSIHGFVTQLGGTVRLESEPGRGTSVTILLPLHEPAPGEGASADRAPDASAQRGNGESILLVEDNPAVRKATAELLEHQGYVVTAVESAAEALKIIESDRKVDLVISDIVMPGALSGLDLEKKLNSERPDLKILLCSGNPDASLSGAYFQGRWRRLRKPFTSRQLTAAVSGFLAAAPSRESKASE